MTKIEQKIPEGWSVKKLGECFKLSSGEAKPKDTDAKGKYPVFGGNGILGFSENYNFSDDNIIIGRVGEYCGCIHRFNGKCWITDNALYIKDKLLKYSNDFMFYLLINDNLSKLRNKGGQPLISQQPIYLEKILLPPLPEQEKIALVLGTWDEAIEKLSSLLEQKKNLKKGLMQRLLTGKTRLKGFTQPWKEVKLGEICKFETAKSKSSVIDENGKYYIIDMGAVSTEGILISSKRTNLCEDLLKVNDIVMPKDDIGGGNIIGKTAIIKQEDAYILSDHVFKLKIHGSDAMFISYLINSFKYNKYMRRVSSGSAILGLAKKDIEKCMLYIPSDITEQKAIADVLSTADEEIDLLNKKLEALKEQKKGLMQQLLTGQTRVKVN